MGLGFGDTWIINSCVGKISKAKEACAELGQSILQVQEDIGGSWRGEAGSAMQTALNQIWAEINQSYQQLAGAESEVRAQGNYIIYNWTDDSES